MNRVDASAVPAPLARPKTGYIPTLDGWRAVAIAGVMLFHGGSLFPRSPVLNRVQNLGANGVELFFAISGLLICSRLMDEERANGNISLRNFYLRRLFRIQPAAFVYLIGVALWRRPESSPSVSRGGGPHCSLCATCTAPTTPPTVRSTPRTSGRWR